MGPTLTTHEPSLVQFRRDYRELLDDVAARQAELGVNAIAAHWPHVGSAYRGLLVVGQALKGWAVDWPPSELTDAGGRERILDEAASVHVDLDEPLSWVPTNARVRRSSFWNFMRRIADAANPGPEPWFARVAWWNLHPLAPTDPEGNPWGALREAQERMAGPLLLDVVEALGANQIALVPGRLRLRTAEPAGLEELTDGWPLFAAGRLDGRSWAVGEHPGWASRQGYGPKRYGPLMAQRLREAGAASPGAGDSPNRLRRMAPASVMTFGSLEAAAACLDEIGLPIGETEGDAIWSSVEVPGGLSRLDEVVLDPACSDAAKTLAGTLLALAPARAEDGRYDFAVSTAS